MRPQHAMWMGLVFAVGTIISLSFAGEGLGSLEVQALNAVSVFRQANILGMWSVTVPNITFFSVGLKSLMAMDFAFFNDSMAVLKWILGMVLGLGLMWGIFSVVIGVISTRFGR